MVSVSVYRLRDVVKTHLSDRCTVLLIISRVGFHSEEKVLCKSRMLRDVYCPVIAALYPKVNILAFESSESSASHGGQKFTGSRSHDHVPLEVPPKP